MPHPDRTTLQRLLGATPPARHFARTDVQLTQQRGTWSLDALTFETVAGEAVPAYFLHPTAPPNPVPAVIYAHAHGNAYHISCEELINGRSSLQGPYADDLMARGIAALCLEMPCFGTRHTPDESTLSKSLLWHGQTLFGQMLGELSAGVSFLQEHAAVDAERIGAIGFSMGSTHAWWLAAMDPRIRAACAMCSFADLQTLIELGAHDGHGAYMTVPGLTRHARSGQIAGLAAPRALHISVGLQDWSTPAAAFDVARRDLEAAYGAAGASERLAFHVAPDAGHHETPQMRAAVLAFLSKHLREA